MSSPETVSCLYHGTIRHRRRAPENEFRHRITLAYLDLDELPRLLGGRLVRPRPGLLRFRRRDYLGEVATPLREAVRDRVLTLSGERPEGQIRVLTQLRSCGICFNPVSFYYCFAPDDGRLQHVLAEVTNTPWGERRAYVLTDRAAGSRVLSGTFDKQLHVSPFFGMDHRYHARACTPGATLSVHIENEHLGTTAFEATLSLRRRELTPASATRLAVTHPAASLQVLALIYGHAAALRLKGARIHPHPAAAR
ncbi:MAG TPA: DUF1365 domain-containing protein [Solirubrobacteraceae bacterium]|nr:DUF1365 domain-containing protein [Solirubrobacteraceae bacterium]